MSEELKGVVVCHGRLAAALVDAAEKISGVTGALIPISNSDCDRDAIEDRIAAAVDGRSAVIFVDMPSGSCFFAALRKVKQPAEVKVVTGANLAMLVDFVFHRSLPAGEAAERAAAAGARAIRSP